MKSLEELDLSHKKYIIFDMDGTLIDSIGIWNITDYRLITSLSGIEVDLNVIQDERNNFLQNNQNSDIYLEYCEYLINKYNLKITKEELLKKRWSISGKYLEEELDYKPYVPELINMLKNMGLTLILATATTSVQLDIYMKKNQKMMQKINLASVFDLILKKEDIKNKKPHPEIYLTAMKKYNASPSVCLVFEDSLHGIIAAKEAGIETVNIYDKYSDIDREKINELTDYKINNYKEFLDFILKQDEMTNEVIE